MQTVLVTGAAGTVGSYVVGLAEAAGYRVIASDRVATGVPQPVRGEVRLGDIRSPSVAERIVKDVDHVIHTAALLDAGTSARELEDTNATAALRLYEAAGAAGAKRFVHMSTAMIYAEDQPGPLTEDAKIASRGVHGTSKLAAERLLQAAKRGPALTILRAAPVYGRRGRHFSASLLSLGPMLKLTLPILPRSHGGPSMTMVHAEDVARALLFVLSRTDTEERVFNIADDDPMPLGERLTETFKAYGLPTVPAGPMQPLVLRTLASTFAAPFASEVATFTSLAAWRLVVLRHRLKPALEPQLDREGLSLLRSDLVVDAGRLRSLGFVARYPRFAEGFRQVLRWYQAERWVPRYA